uniref:Uncharacterized protein n=1 Tax=Ditylenchus dipsaci TaxID=166011 RepID=A0A915ENI4_9BILA
MTDESQSEDVAEQHLSIMLDFLCIVYFVCRQSIFANSGRSYDKQKFKDAGSKLQPVNWEGNEAYPIQKSSTKSIQLLLVVHKPKCKAA